MSVAPKWYGNGLLNVFKGNIDMDSDTFKLSLHTSSYTPNQDTDDYFDDATNQLSTANGYTAGGVTLGSLALTYDAATNQVRWDFADPTWTFSSSVTWRHGVIRKSRGGAASADEVLAYLTWSADQTVNGVYVLQLDALGLLYNTAT